MPRLHPLAGLVWEAGVRGVRDPTLTVFSPPTAYTATPSATKPMLLEAGIKVHSSGDR